MSDVIIYGGIILLVIALIMFRVITIVVNGMNVKDAAVKAIPSVNISVNAQAVIGNASANTLNGGAR